MFSKAVDWQWLALNPASKIKMFEEKSRERFLQEDELPRFFKALDAEPNQDFADVFRLCLFTGARRSNVLAMKWQDVQVENAEWKIPETKNGESHLVPLLPQALEILTERRSRAGKGAGWVFPSTTSQSGHLEGVQRVWSRLLKDAALENLRIHDLRRTLGSWLVITGANNFTIGKTLGHKTQQATAVYARLNTKAVRDSVAKATEVMLGF
jgi:integrase